MIIFFDIDETLLDQRAAEAAAAVDFLDRYGGWLDRPYALPEFCGAWRALREKHVRLFFDGLAPFQETRRGRIRELFGARAERMSNREIDDVFDFYEQRYRGAWSLFADVLPALEMLAGHTCGIISNGTAAQQRMKLAATGIARYFPIVVVSEEAGAAKPDKRIFQAACEQARTAPERCFHIGDRLDHDALAGRAAGMRTLWLDRRGAAPGADIDVVHSLFDVCRNLELRMTG